MNARSAAWTAEKRAAHSARMRTIMNDPTIRHKVSEGTKVGMKNVVTDELRALRSLWRGTSTAARKRFLEEMFSPCCLEGPGSIPGGQTDQPANLQVETAADRGGTA